MQKLVFESPWDMMETERSPRNGVEGGTTTAFGVSDGICAMLTQRQATIRFTNALQVFWAKMTGAHTWRPPTDDRRRYESPLNAAQTGGFLWHSQWNDLVLNVRISNYGIAMGGTCMPLHFIYRSSDHWYFLMLLMLVWLSTSTIISSVCMC